MTEGAPSRAIIRFAIPLILGYLLQQMYLIIDAAIVGRWIGVGALAAVGASSSIMFLVMGFCNGSCAGFAIPVAQAFGTRKLQRVKTGVNDSMWIMLAYFALTVIIIYPFADEMMMLFVNGNEQEVINNAARLMRICNWFYPSLGVLVILRYSIQGLGYSNLSMMSGVMEMIARCGVSIWLVPALAWTGVCYADPVAWVMAGSVPYSCLFMAHEKTKETTRIVFLSPLSCLQQTCYA